ncbi:hypothetical protein NKI79_19890 [Mesorhizobium sp. M0340]|uniref:hypothetical protein n=1 Tax=Mesorhizobium sp. M0340 TaxID=2956939 RepID=UPI003335CC21
MCYRPRVLASATIEIVTPGRRRNRWVALDTYGVMIGLGRAALAFALILSGGAALVTRR